MVKHKPAPGRCLQTRWHGWVRRRAARYGEALLLAVVAQARDGYRVAFTLGELDPLPGKAQVVLADRCNGAMLNDEDGPFRLVVAGDTRGGRSVRQVVSLRLAAFP